MALSNVKVSVQVTNISRIILSQTIKWLNLHNVQYCKLMKKSLFILLAAAMLSLTGCDFLRNLAGRPTSEDIQAKRLELLRAQELIEEARLDSLRREKQMVLDSIAALDSIKQQGGTILNPSKLGGLFATKLEARYYIVVGCFRQRSNAEILLGKVSEIGYSPALISFRNGMIAVGLCPVNTLTDALASLKAVKNEPFCPSDVWILVNE